MNKRSEGKEYEARAAAYLSKQGLRLVESNYLTRQGEIDLIMRDDNTLVFVEVRYRRNSHYGGAAISITPAKQRKIALAALQYLQVKKQTHLACRFDAVTISPAGLEWIADAFHSPL